MLVPSPIYNLLCGIIEKQNYKINKKLTNVKPPQIQLKWYRGNLQQL